MNVKEGGVMERKKESEGGVTIQWSSSKSLILQLRVELK